jgi:hypothetical protein
MKRNITIAIECEGENYRDVCKTMLADPAVSDWLKRGILALARRDPVDALGDCSMLMTLATARIEEIEAAHERASDAAAVAMEKMRAAP